MPFAATRLPFTEALSTENGYLKHLCTQKQTLQGLASLVFLLVYAGDVGAWIDGRVTLMAAGRGQEQNVEN